MKPRRVVWDAPQPRAVEQRRCDDAVGGEPRAIGGEPDGATIRGHGGVRADVDLDARAGEHLGDGSARLLAEHGERRGLGRDEKDRCGGAHGRGA